MNREQIEQLWREANNKADDFQPNAATQKLIDQFVAEYQAFPAGDSHTLFGRLLFVYALNGVVKCFSPEEIRPIESVMQNIGWKHTATIDPARWIELMANGNADPSDMLDELHFCLN